MLTWLHGAAAAAAAFLWLSFRVVHHVRRPSWVQTVFVTLNVPVSASVISMIGIGVITVGLLHRKRLALIAVGGLQLAGAIWSVADLTGFISGVTPVADAGESLALTIVSLIVAMAMMAVLVWLWPAFPARSARGSWLAAGSFLAAGMLLAVLVTSILIELWPTGSGSVTQQVTVSLLHSAGLPAPRSLRGVHVGNLVPQATSLIVGAAILGAVVVFLRSARNDDRWQPTQEVEVRRLLMDFGEADSLGYIATRRDMLLHFDARRRAAVSYQVLGSVCLASGDPVGDPLAWTEAITSWEALARRHGWTPAVLACSTDGARAYARALRFDILRLGEEAILHPHSSTWTPPR